MLRPTRRAFIEGLIGGVVSASSGLPRSFSAVSSQTPAKVIQKLTPERLKFLMGRFVIPIHRLDQISDFEIGGELDYWGGPVMIFSKLLQPRDTAPDDITLRDLLADENQDILRQAFNHEIERLLGEGEPFFKVGDNEGAQVLRDIWIQTAKKLLASSEYGDLETVLSMSIRDIHKGYGFKLYEDNWGALIKKEYEEMARFGDSNFGAYLRTHGIEDNLTYAKKIAPEMAETMDRCIAANRSEMLRKIKRATKNSHQFELRHLSSKDGQNFYSLAVNDFSSLNVDDVRTFFSGDLPLSQDVCVEKDLDQKHFLINTHSPIVQSIMDNMASNVRTMGENRVPSIDYS